jgi:hypothetical protein
MLSSAVGGSKKPMRMRILNRRVSTVSMSDTWMLPPSSAFCALAVMNPPQSTSVPAPRITATASSAVLV